MYVYESHLYEENAGRNFCAEGNIAATDSIALSRMNERMNVRISDYKPTLILLLAHRRNESNANNEIIKIIERVDNKINPAKRYLSATYFYSFL